MHSEQAQSVRVTEKISFGGHQCRDFTRSEDKCIFILISESRPTF